MSFIEEFDWIRQWAHSSKVLKNLTSELHSVTFTPLFSPAGPARWPVRPRSAQTDRTQMMGPVLIRFMLTGFLLWLRRDVVLKSKEPTEKTCRLPLSSTVSCLCWFTAELWLFHINGSDLWHSWYRACSAALCWFVNSSETLNSSWNILYFQTTCFQQALQY